VLMPYICCKKCSAHIWLPLPIEGDEPTSYKTWPWGGTREYIRCGECFRVDFYWAEDSRTSLYKPGEQIDLDGLSLYRLHARCTSKNCDGTVSFLAPLPRGASLKDIAKLVEKTLPNGSICDRGHAIFAPTAGEIVQCVEVALAGEGKQVG
jgi:hypothetical protein